MNHLIYALTAPADKVVFNRISSARSNFLAWCDKLREKKIDVEHAVANFHQLQETESFLKRAEAIEKNTKGVVSVDKYLYGQIRRERIYFRVLLLDLLNQEDAWLASEDAKRKPR
ncbi:hypothetical protein GURKE_02880 [Brevundimonas phage vB_BpoS-Gurke]|uniref:Uncharacterized protein n=1 Tax=Brevundimonas phage vB_BpoS-Gurke TaxID=2948599 RepID=A0A9E7N4Q1_9CAUD|nr:hypothetical protein GURKE_02880 [Brevundimonas phage vB_BpoS-Gurke]